MKFRIIIFIIYILFGLNILHSQNIEPFNIVYDLNYYKSYYNYKIKTSSFVIYKLYKGGGDIPRKNMRFKSYNKLPHFNYYYSGYDRGHLVPAEDFAYSYNRLLTTFYYINCVPQTIKLNRGNWKIYETKIRQYSWKDSLIIICGGCDYDSVNIYIPRRCFKLVYSLTTQKCIYSLIFENNLLGRVSYNKKLEQLFPFRKINELYYIKN